MSRAVAWNLAMAVALAAIAAGVVVQRQSPTQAAFLAEGRSAMRRVPASRTVEPGSAVTAVSQQTATTVAAPEPTTAPVAVAPRRTRVTAIGDSVLMEAEHELTAALGDFSLDATVGRQMGDTLQAVHALHDAGRLGGEIVVQVGNNGTVTSGEFHELMSLLSGARRVVVVNVKVDREWEASNNAVVAAGVAKWRNAILLDWYSLGTADPDLLYDDGVHLRPGGVHVYARLILSGL